MEDKKVVRAVYWIVLKTNACVKHLQKLLIAQKRKRSKDKKRKEEKNTKKCRKKCKKKTVKRKGEFVALAVFGDFGVSAFVADMCLYLMTKFHSWKKSCTKWGFGEVEMLWFSMHNASSKHKM